MKVRIKWSEAMTFVAESGTGHSIVIDGAPEEGGRNLAARPMETVLMGTGACTAYDVVLILKKMRQPIEDCVVELEAERAPEPPRVFTKIHLHYRIKGRGLDPNKVRNAVELSKEKYCSATIMLAKTAEISYAITIDHGEPS